MKQELILTFYFEASHSLAEYEVPHPHRWRLECVLTGKPVDGKIVDIVFFRSKIDSLLSTLKLTYLNDNSRVGAEVNAFPTCETLGYFFYQESQKILETDVIPTNASVQMSSITVGIADLDGIETGAARLIR